jgi:hypothetical protein
MQGIRAKVSEAGSVKCSPARWATAATLLKCCLCGQSKSPHASAHRHYAGDQDQITTPSAGIMPDHVGDRGAAHLDPGASRSPTYQADPDIGQQCQLCAGPHRSISFCSAAGSRAPSHPGVPIRRIFRLLRDARRACIPGKARRTWVTWCCP